jgi:hypothetical protein
MNVLKSDKGNKSVRGDIAINQSNICFKRKIYFLKQPTSLRNTLVAPCRRPVFANNWKHKEVSEITGKLERL